SMYAGYCDSNIVHYNESVNAVVSVFFNGQPEAARESASGRVSDGDYYLTINELSELNHAKGYEKLLERNGIPIRKFEKQFMQDFVKAVRSYKERQGWEDGWKGHSGARGVFLQTGEELTGPNGALNRNGFYEDDDSPFFDLIKKYFKYSSAALESRTNGSMSVLEKKWAKAARAFMEHALINQITQKYFEGEIPIKDIGISSLRSLLLRIDIFVLPSLLENLFHLLIVPYLFFMVQGILSGHLNPVEWPTLDKNMKFNFIEWATASIASITFLHKIFHPMQRFYKKIQKQYYRRVLDDYIMDLTPRVKSRNRNEYRSNFNKIREYSDSRENGNMLQRYFMNQSLAQLRDAVRDGLDEKERFVRMGRYGFHLAELGQELDISRDEIMAFILTEFKDRNPDAYDKLMDGWEKKKPDLFSSLTHYVDLMQNDDYVDRFISGERSHHPNDNMLDKKTVSDYMSELKLSEQKKYDIGFLRDLFNSLKMEADPSVRKLVLVDRFFAGAYSRLRQITEEYERGNMPPKDYSRRLLANVGEMIDILKSVKRETEGNPGDRRYGLSLEQLDFMIKNLGSYDRKVTKILSVIGKGASRASGLPQAQERAQGLSRSSASGSALDTAREAKQLTVRKAKLVFAEDLSQGAVPLFSIGRAWKHKFENWKGNNIYKTPLTITDHAILSIVGFIAVTSIFTSFGMLLGGFNHDAVWQIAIMMLVISPQWSKLVFGHIKDTRYGLIASKSLRARYPDIQNAKLSAYRMRQIRDFIKSTGWDVVWTDDPNILAKPELGLHRVIMTIGWVLDSGDESDNSLEKIRVAYLRETLKIMRESIEASGETRIGRSAAVTPGAKAEFTRDYTEERLLGENSAWIGFMDMAKAGLRNTVYGHKVMDLVIEEALAIVQKELWGNGRGIGFKISGDEIGFFIPPYMSAEEVRQALIGIQQTLSDKFLDKDFVNILAEKMRDRKISEKAIEKFIKGTYVPFEPAGCVRLEGIQDEIGNGALNKRMANARALLKKNLRYAEIVQGYAKEPHAGVIELVKVVEDFQSPEEDEPSILTLDENTAIGKARSRMNSMKMFGFEVEDEYPSLKRENLWEVVEMASRKRKPGVYFARGPPDTFYCIRAYGSGKVQVIKIASAYKPLNKKTKSAFDRILRESGREIKKRASDAVGYYGFKSAQDASRIYEKTGHERGNDWIKLENLGIYNTFSLEDDETRRRPLTEKEILAKLISAAQPVNSRTIEKDHKKISFEVVFDASVVSSIDLRPKALATSMLPIIEELDEAREDVLRMGLGEGADLNTRDASVGKTSPEVKPYAINKSGWDAITAENEAALFARTKRAEPDLEDADRILTESLKIALEGGIARSIPEELAEPMIAEPETTASLISDSSRNLNAIFAKLQKIDNGKRLELIKRKILAGSQDIDIDKILERLDDIFENGIYYQGYGLAYVASVIGGGRPCAETNITGEAAKKFLEGRGGEIWRRQGFNIVFDQRINKNLYGFYHKAYIYNVDMVRDLINSKRSFLEGHMGSPAPVSIKTDMTDNEIEKFMEHLLVTQDPLQGLFFGFPQGTIEMYMDPKTKREEGFGLSEFIDKLTEKKYLLKPFSGFITNEKTLERSIDAALEAQKGWERALGVLENMQSAYMVDDSHGMILSDHGGRGAKDLDGTVTGMVRAYDDQANASKAPEDQTGRASASGEMREIGLPIVIDATNLETKILNIEKAEKKLFLRIRALAYSGILRVGFGRFRAHMSGTHFIIGSEDNNEEVFRLREVIGNAVEKGKAGRVELSTYIFNEEDFILKVRDDGIGIPRSRAESFFETTFNSIDVCIDGREVDLSCVLENWDDITGDGISTGIGIMLSYGVSLREMSQIIFNTITQDGERTQVVVRRSTRDKRDGRIGRKSVTDLGVNIDRGTEVLFDFGGVLDADKSTIRAFLDAQGYLRRSASGIDLKMPGAGSTLITQLPRSVLTENVLYIPSSRGNSIIAAVGQEQLVHHEGAEYTKKGGILVPVGQTAASITGTSGIVIPKSQGDKVAETAKTNAMKSINEWREFLKRPKDEQLAVVNDLLVFWDWPKVEGSLSSSTIFRILDNKVSEEVACKLYRVLEKMRPSLDFTNDEFGQIILSIKKYLKDKTLFATSARLGISDISQDEFTKKIMDAIASGLAKLDNRTYELYLETLAAMPVTFVEDSLPNLPKDMTFGVEMELFICEADKYADVDKKATGILLDELIRAVADAIDHGSLRPGWVVKPDGVVEINTPILTNTKEGFAEMRRGFDYISTYLKANYSNRQLVSSIHVHIGNPRPKDIKTTRNLTFIGKSMEYYWNKLAGEPVKLSDRFFSAEALVGSLYTEKNSTLFYEDVGKGTIAFTELPTLSLSKNDSIAVMQKSIETAMNIVYQASIGKDRFDMLDWGLPVLAGSDGKDNRYILRKALDRLYLDNASGKRSMLQLFAVMGKDRGLAKNAVVDKRELKDARQQL
ncbi:MAG: ATP-binding protein, partial [Candidatus Omnitrophota bacterium]|nr:ATP-binding protein [Candidatus Omnitrophota bacterium]